MGLDSRPEDSSVTSLVDQKLADAEKFLLEARGCADRMPDDPEPQSGAHASNAILALIDAIAALKVAVAAVQTERTR